MRGAFGGPNQGTHEGCPYKTATVFGPSCIGSNRATIRSAHDMEEERSR